MLLSATYLLSHTPKPSDDEIRHAIQGNICRCTGYVNIVKAIRAARANDRDGDRTAQSSSRSATPASRASRARRTAGSSRARASSRTTSSGTGWATSTSSARRTRTRGSSRSTSRAAEALDGVYGTLTPDEVAELTDPFFELTTRPGNADQGLRARRRRSATSASRSSRSSPRPASSRATPPTSSRSSTSRSTCSSTRAARRTTRRVIHDDAGTNVVWSGRLRLGRRRRRAEGRRPRREDQGAPLRPLLVDAARVLRRACRVRPAAPASSRSFATTRCPASRRSGWGRRCASPLDKLRFVTQDIGGGFGNKITTHPQLTACCLLARKLKRPVQWTEWRTDQHTANAHGNERWFHDIEVAVQTDGTMLGFKVKALDDCGAFPRYEPLGCIIWAQVTPGLLPLAEHPRRLHAGRDEQVAGGAEPRLLANAASLADRADLRHRRARARPRSGRGPQEELRVTEEMPYETPNGCIYDSGDYARCLDIALELIDYDGVARPAGGRARREAPRDRHRLDARLGHEQLRPVDAPEPGAAVLREQRSGDDQARHLRRDRAHARDGAAGPGPRDGRGQVAPTSSASRPTRSTCDPGTTLLELARGLLRHVRVAVRGHRARGGEGRGREALARDPPARRRRARRRRSRRHRPRGRLREDRGQPGGGAAVHGLRRDHQREQRRAPARAARHHAQLPPRLRAAVRRCRTSRRRSAT